MNANTHFRGARASRVLVATSRRDELSCACFPEKIHARPGNIVFTSSFWRDAKTSTRGARAPLSFLLALTFLITAFQPLRAEEKPSDVQTLIPWLLKEDQNLKSI